MITCSDAIAYTRTLPDNSVNCVVTSPPYWQQRDYGVDGQMGMESNLNDYLQYLETLFLEIKRILTPDGTIWVNLGDKRHNKQLMMIPSRFALRMMDIGLFVRNEIIWHKPAPPTLFGGG